MWAYTPSSLSSFFVLVLILSLVWILGFGIIYLQNLALSHKHTFGFVSSDDPISLACPAPTVPKPTIHLALHCLGLGKLLFLRLVLFLFFLLVVIGIHCFCFHETPGVRMLGLIVGVFFVMKVWVVVEHQNASDVAWSTNKNSKGNNRKGMSMKQWIYFSLGWPGMRPGLFMDKEPRKDSPEPRENPFGKSTPTSVSHPSLLKQGLIRIGFGVVFLCLAKGIWLFLVNQQIESGVGKWMITVCLLVGISCVLHFGIFSVLTFFWQRRGILCEAPFQHSLQSQSLSEFWSRRWNLAFSEMTGIIVFRPLIQKAGKPLALLGSFFFSGILHEIAISLPVLTGFGGPLFYFLLHGGLVMIENQLKTNRYQVKGWLGRVWTFFWLVVPLPLLFHTAFLRGILWPILGIK